MTTKKSYSPLVGWFFPSIKDVLFLTFLLAPYMASDWTVLGDSDTGWHIRSGEHILATLSFPHQDFFSYTCYGKPWFAWEWLSDVIMALIHGVAGLNGIMVWATLTFAFVFTLLFHWLLRRGANILLATFFSLLAATSSTIHWHARPHLFTMVFLFGWIMALETVQEKAERGDPIPSRYWIFFMATMLIWTNLHGGFVTGLIMLGIYSLGNYLSFIVSSKPEVREMCKKISWIFLRLLLICFLLTAANPYGFKIHQHILNSYLHSSYLVDNIAEFVSPNFHWPTVKCFEAILICSIVTLAFSWKRLTFVETGLILFWTHMALFSSRHIPLYSLAVTPILVRHSSQFLQNPKTAEQLSPLISKCLEAFNSTAKGFSQFEIQFRGWIYPILALFLLSGIAINQGNFLGLTIQRAEFDQKIFPVKAASFVESHPQTGNFFTTDQWGGYWIYRFFPQYKVFFDGRSDMYGEAFLKRYQKITGLSYDWKSVIEEYKIGWFLLPVRDSLATALKEDPGWKILYDDHVAIIFKRN